MRWLSRVFFLPALLLPAPAFAWAPEGHQIVAAVAAQELSPHARARVAALLGGDASTMMVLDSSWADEIRQQRPQTNPWHYVDIEVGSNGYSAPRDCAGGDCVVAQIERDARTLSDPHASKAAQTEALRFLIHFVGDVHQPLHAADRSDQGGNSEAVSWRGKRVRLHGLWDQDVVAALGRDWARVAADIEAGLTPPQKAMLARGTPADWANDSFHVAEKEIYAGLPSAGRIRLPPDYDRRENTVARLQLTKAGLRLAALLNRIFR